MTSRKALIARIIIITALYFGLSSYGGEFGRNMLYPIRVFVTFLHELGHAVGALITGGSVEYIRIDPNAGGLTRSLGGNGPIITMGGYIGSAIFGNLLFYVGARSQKLVKPVLALVIVTGFIWYNSLFTTLILCVFAAALFGVGFKTNYGREILMLLGLASIIYILQDTASGPSSDLAAFEAQLSFFSANVWMLIWLGLALGLLAINFKMLFRIKAATSLSHTKLSKAK